MWREVVYGVVPPIAYVLLLRAARRHIGRVRRACRPVARDAHNVALALYSAWAAVDVAVRLAREGRLSDPHALVCQTPSDDGGWRWRAWYWSKMWEWVDT
ncbi:MAG: hypothetical protein VXX04_01265, partial [Actinomycetota bacterium]|nr:hypothetical protein [Actinomycetota bacterium]